MWDACFDEPGCRRAHISHRFSDPRMSTYCRCLASRRGLEAVDLRLSAEELTQRSDQLRTQVRVPLWLAWTSLRDT